MILIGMRNFHFRWKLLWRFLQHCSEDSLDFVLIFYVCILLELEVWNVLSIWHWAAPLVLGSWRTSTCFDQFCIYLWGPGRTLHSAFWTAEPCLWLFFSNASSSAFSWRTLIHTYSCPSSSFKTNLLSSALSVPGTLKCSVFKRKAFW